MKRYFLVAFFIILGGGLLWWALQKSPEGVKHFELPRMNSSISEAGQAKISWQCMADAQFHHDVNLKSETQVTSRAAHVSQQQASTNNWYFHLAGTVEESCLKEIGSAHDRRWLVHYRWLPSSLQQNIHNSSSQFADAMGQAIKKGVFVERNAQQIFQIRYSATGQSHNHIHEVAFELWRMFLLGQMICEQSAAVPSSSCNEAWLSADFVSNYELQIDAWHKAAKLPRSHQQLNLLQDLKLVLSQELQESRPKSSILTLQSRQESAVTSSQDESVMEIILQARTLLAADSRQALLEELGRARIYSHAKGQRQQAQDAMEQIYRQEIANVKDADLWRQLDSDDDRTDRYMQIKAWTHLNRHRLDLVKAELWQRPFADPLLQLWIKALSQTGGAEGQHLLYEMLVARSEEKNLAKYTLAGLAFAEEPADELDALLQNLLDNPEFPDELKMNVLLTIGTWAGRLTGERAEALSQYLLSRWGSVYDAEQRLAVLQAIGNSGFSGAKELLTKIAEQETDQRLISEAVFALRFVDGALPELLKYLGQDPHKQGAIRALRFTKLDNEQYDMVVKTALSMPQQSGRYQIVASLLQNPSSLQIDPGFWQTIQEQESDASIRELIASYLDHRQTRG